jgi:hypothetical protein
VELTPLLDRLARRETRKTEAKVSRERVIGNGGKRERTSSVEKVGFSSAIAREKMLVSEVNPRLELGEGERTSDKSTFSFLEPLDSGHQESDGVADDRSRK